MFEMHVYAERLGDEKILYSTLLYSMVLLSTQYRDIQGVTATVT